jgi:isopenicillin-N epimerase
MESPEPLWLLDPDVVYLNHGAFGACARPVLARQQRWRERMEREPVRFFARELEGLYDATRQVVAGFLGAEPSDLVFVQNATTGVNAVVRSLRFSAGDELLTTNHGYNACRNALEVVAHRDGATVVVAPVPFPLRASDPATAEDELVDAVLSAVTPRTRLALLDHVTSQTALVFPVARLVAELEGRGIDTLVDGAHAPACCPWSSARWGPPTTPAISTNGSARPRGRASCTCGGTGRRGCAQRSSATAPTPPVAIAAARLLEFDWIGTVDPSAVLSVPEAIATLDRLDPGGWRGLAARNHRVVVAQRRRLAGQLEVELPCPDELLGTMAALPLPGRVAAPAPGPFDPLQDRLWQRHRIEVPVFVWTAPPVPRRLLRISAQCYTTDAHFDALAEALRRELATE